MILKIERYTDFSFTLIDNVSRISFSDLKTEKWKTLKRWADIYYLDNSPPKGTNDDSDIVYACVSFFKDGKETNLVCNTNIYICNDSGHTVDRITCHK